MKKFLRRVLVVAPMLALAACASSKVSDKLEEEYKSGTASRDEKVGLKDDKIVIQKRITLEEQLATLTSEVEELQRITYGKSRKDPGGTWEGLKDCRKKLSDPRLGGTGKPEPMERWEEVGRKDVEYEHAVTKDKKVEAVTEEGLNDRMGRLKTARNLLNDRYESFKDKLDACEESYKTKLVEHGLDPEDSKAQGEWVDGPHGYKVWKMKRSGTADPEEMMKRKKTRESNSVETEN